MGKSPKEKEVIIERAVNAVGTIAPGAKFNGIGITELSAQAELCLAPRRQLAASAATTIEQIARRDAQDEVFMRMLEKVVLGVLSDDDYGEDSALYEALGFVRKSQRKSGLTHKRKSEVKEMK